MKLALTIRDDVAVYDKERVYYLTHPPKYEEQTTVEIQVEGHPLLIAGHLRAVAAQLENGETS